MVRTPFDYYITGPEGKRKPAFILRRKRRTSMSPISNSGHNVLPHIIFIERDVNICSIIDSQHEDDIELHQYVIED